MGITACRYLAIVFLLKQVLPNDGSEAFWFDGGVHHLHHHQSITQLVHHPDQASYHYQDYNTSHHILSKFLVVVFSQPQVLVPIESEAQLEECPVLWCVFLICCPILSKLTGSLQTVRGLAYRVVERICPFASLRSPSLVNPFISSENTSISILPLFVNLFKALLEIP